MRIKITDIKEMWGTNDEQVGIMTKNGDVLFSFKLIFDGEYLNI